MPFPLQVSLLSVDGTPAPTKELRIVPSDRLDLFSGASPQLVKGAATINLPSLDDPGIPAGMFYTITRNRWGLVGPAVTSWIVPAQAGGVAVHLTDYPGDVPPGGGSGGGSSIAGIYVSATEPTAAGWRWWIEIDPDNDPIDVRRPA